MRCNFLMTQCELHENFSEYHFTISNTWRMTLEGCYFNDQGMGGGVLLFTMSQLSSSAGALGDKAIIIIIVSNKENGLDLKIDHFKMQQQVVKTIFE